MQFRLRTLLIILAVLPVLIWLAYLSWTPLTEFIIDDVIMRGIP